MHPDFFNAPRLPAPDRPGDTKNIVRRNAPERLDLTLPTPHFPAVVPQPPNRPPPAQGKPADQTQKGGFLKQIRRRFTPAPAV